jgi:hypothetical protein
VNRTPKRPRDPNQLGKFIVDLATGAATDQTPEPSESGKDPAAVLLGRRGGLKGGRARAASLTPEQRAETAKKAERSHTSTLLSCAKRSLAD